MNYAINLNAVTPLRRDPSEQSEMISQLLFGEIISVEKEAAGFWYVCNLTDAYKGWADRRMLTDLPQKELEKIKKNGRYLASLPVSEAFCMDNKSIIRLTGGSHLPAYDPATARFGIEGHSYQIHPDFVVHPEFCGWTGLVESALAFLNTPYLWGGKSVMGMDCSGFVQVLYSLYGRMLPRDAKDQARKGQPVPDLEQAQAGDLAFFAYPGKDISHVGILTGQGQIVHAYGKICIDTLSPEGKLPESEILLACVRRYS